MPALNQRHLTVTLNPNQKCYDVRRLNLTMNEITTADLELLLHKLFVEQIPVTVYYQRKTE